MKEPVRRPTRFEAPRWLSPADFRALESAGTTACRLVTTPGGWIERLGEDVLISHKSDEALAEFRAGLDTWCAETGFAPRRLYGKFLPLQNAERIAPVLLAGDASLPPTAEATESGVRYGLDFEAGYSAGLFIDQRHNRAFLRRRRPGRVLNTFAYTCSFSVVGAMEGARTTSLDLSAKSLDRGKANFALNGLSTEGHSFLADDVLEVLPRLVRRGEKYDAIILDPPTFSRGNKGRRFQVETGLEELIGLALELAAPKAAILISTNCTRLGVRDLEQMARYQMKVARRTADFHREASLVDIPAGAGAQTLWLLLK